MVASSICIFDRVMKYHCRRIWNSVQGIHQNCNREGIGCSKNWKRYQKNKDTVIFRLCVFLYIALFSTGDLEKLTKEISTMLSFEHEHVMSLIGVCIDGEMPLLIMPFMSNGSVLDYVRNYKDKLLITGQFLKEEVIVLLL